MAQITYADVVKANMDAGLFRQFLAQAHGATLTYGTSCYGAMERAMRHSRQLARLTGMAIEDVLAQVRADYELIA